MSKKHFIGIERYTISDIKAANRDPKLIAEAVEAFLQREGV